MKKSFPDFKGRNINEVIINPKNQKIIDKFLTEVRGSAGKNRTRNINNLIIQIYYASETDLDKWDYDVLSSFLSILNKSKKKENSKNDIKKTLKRFLRFYYDDWNIRFKGLKSSSLKQKDGVNKEKRGNDKLLSPEDIENLISGCDKFMYQALFSLAIQTAGRVSELLNLKWNNLNFDTSKVKLIRYKTGNQTDILLEHLNYLKNHFNNYPFPKPKQDDYIFPSPKNRNKPLSNQTATSYLNTIAKRTIGREDLFLYIFRHTTLNTYRKILSPDQYERFADHSLELGMKMYGHNDTEDLDKELNERIFNKQILTQEDKNEIKELKKKIEDQDKKMDNFIKTYGDILDSFIKVKQFQNTKKTALTDEKRPSRIDSKPRFL